MNKLPLTDFKAWPPVPAELLKAITEWASQPGHCAEWTAGMTGYDAIGALAHIKGMGHVIAKLKNVHRKQHDAAIAHNQPSHVRK